MGTGGVIEWGVGGGPSLPATLSVKFVDDR